MLAAFTSQITADLELARQQFGLLPALPASLAMVLLGADAITLQALLFYLRLHLACGTQLLRQRCCAPLSG